MKRFYFLAASIFLLAACSGLEQPDQDLFIDDSENLVEKVVFEVLPIKDGDAPATRASAVPAGGTVSFAWEENDMIGIYPNKGSQIYFTIEDGAGSSSATFDGGGWALKQNASYVSYYPFVADFFLSRDEIPVSFAGQKQVGIESPFNGARYFLATEPTSSENGVLRFSYKTLNTIINVNATLPAGTYTKMSLTVEEPLFVEEGTYSLDDRAIVGTKFTNTLEIELENVVLTEQATIPIYIMSAPVDLKGKEVTVRIISSEGQHFECVKKPSKTYEAGTRYGLTCDNMVQSNVVFDDEIFKAYCVENFDSDGDGEVSYAEAKVVTYIDVPQKGISSLKGIESFTNLTQLYFEHNQLTSLDVSHNTALEILFCSNNQLTSLYVGQNTALRNLECSSNQLTSLDVRGCTALTILSCCFNQLTSLDVSHNTALTNLYCFDNQLTSLDVSQNTSMSTLRCESNPTLIDIWLKNGQTIQTFSYDTDVATIRYKDQANGHEYVDMGDAGKWATMNIGAESPAGSGDYFAWGETVSKDTYYSSNYSYTGDSRTLPADNDAATANWGSPWRTPTEDEWTMLKNECTWTWTKENNVNGYKVTSKKNGNSIFIPASGFYVDNEYYGSGLSGYYWASSCNEELLEGYAGAFGVVSDEPYLTDFEKYAGLPVRPVVAE